MRRWSLLPQPPPPHPNPKGSGPYSPQLTSGQHTSRLDAQTTNRLDRIPITTGHSGLLETPRWFQNIGSGFPGEGFEVSDIKGNY